LSQALSQVSILHAEKLATLKSWENASNEYTYTAAKSKGFQTHIDVFFLSQQLLLALRKLGVAL
jgi:hypothetical protein